MVGNTSSKGSTGSELKEKSFAGINGVRFREKNFLWDEGNGVSKKSRAGINGIRVCKKKSMESMGSVLAKKSIWQDQRDERFVN